MVLQKRGIQMRKETRIVNCFNFNNRKYRMHYTSRGSVGRASIQLNQSLKCASSVLCRIIRLHHYRFLRIFLHHSFLPKTSEEFSTFYKDIHDESYVVSDCYSSLNKPEDIFVLICVLKLNKPLL